MTTAIRVSRAVTTVVLLTILPAGLMGQTHPYRAIDNWGTLPDGRTWGSTSAIFPSPDGNIWVAERCGQNTCAGREHVDPILLFTPDGRLLRSFGAGLVLWPHGMFVDVDANVWVTDGDGPETGDPGGARGHVVLKFSPSGQLLMTLGRKGIPGQSRDTFRRPSDVLVTPGGEIFVADGHGRAGNNRIVKFSRDGRFIREWGTTGAENGEFRDPHALAMDSQGRLFVGDRGNSRIQIFTQDGDHLATWTQFGRPSGLFIDGNDVLYSTDSESNTDRNPGWRRGIYVGSAIDGFVMFFIPDPEPDPDNSSTSGAEGIAVGLDGSIYGAEVGPAQVRKYVRRLAVGR